MSETTVSWAIYDANGDKFALPIWSQPISDVALPRVGEQFSLHRDRMGPYENEELIEVSGSVTKVDTLMFPRDGSVSLEKRLYIDIKVKSIWDAKKGVAVDTIREKKS